jgi:hypothetical protein
MKIIITEEQYKLLLESTDKTNVVEQLLEMEGIKYDGCEYDGRNRDSFGRTHDSVVFYFEFPNNYKHRSIRFLTKNNKVVSVSSASDFRTIADGFKYIPKKTLMEYFIEEGKTHLEKILSLKYPNDSLKESVIKEDTLKSELKQMIKSDGWEETYPLVGDAETLAQFAFDNDPMKFIDLLITKKRKGKHSDFFGDDDDRLFLQFTPDMEVVELNFELSEFLLLGFKLDKNGAKNVIKDWLFDRYGIEIKDVSKIYL